MTGTLHPRTAGPGGGLNIVSRIGSRLAGRSRPCRASVTRAASDAARWSRGVLSTAWEYLTLTRRVHRFEEPGSVGEDMPPPLPSGVAFADLQDLADGVGPLMHRSYVVRLRGSCLSARDLIEAFAGRPNRASPLELAEFEKDRGEEGELRVGDEFTIHIPGPWDGPVRVVETQESGFGFVTRAGHLEAGRIRFGARELDDGCLEVRIESWARGGDHVSNVLFDWIGINKEMQLHMWTSVLTRLTQLCSGRRDGPVIATTRRVDPDELARSEAVPAS